MGLSKAATALALANNLNDFLRLNDFMLISFESKNT